MTSGNQAPGEFRHEIWSEVDHFIQVTRNVQLGQHGHNTRSQRGISNIPARQKYSLARHKVLSTSILNQPGHIRRPEGTSDNKQWSAKVVSQKPTQPGVTCCEQLESRRHLVERGPYPIHSHSYDIERAQTDVLPLPIVELVCDNGCIQ